MFKYIKNNVKYPYFRRLVVQEYKKEKKYESAIQLIKEGINLCDRWSFDELKYWESELFDICKITNNKEEIVNLSEKLILEGRSIKENVEAIRESLGLEEFNEYVDRLSKKIARNSPFFRNEILRYLYINAEKWNDLIDLSSKLSLEQIVECEKSTPEEFKQGYVRVYEKAIYSKAERSHGKPEYELMGKAVRRLAAIAPQIAAPLIAHLRLTKSRRYLLMAELEGI